MHGRGVSHSPAPRLQDRGHTSQSERNQIARDISAADERDWDDQFAQEEDESGLADAAEELGSFDDGMGDLNSFAFIAYVHTRKRLFIVEVNARTLQGVMAGQGRGTQCIHAAVTHLPAGVDASDIDTVDLHQERGNLDAENLYTARGFWKEEREGKVNAAGKMPKVKDFRIYQVDDPPKGETEATWIYRRRNYEELRAEIATHRHVVKPAPAPEWEYFSSRLDLETQSPHLWEIVKTMTERFHGSEGVCALLHNHYITVT